jgi:hypothetical protein
MNPLFDHLIRFVMRHHTNLTEVPSPKFIHCFGADGVEIPWETVFAAAARERGEVDAKDVQPIPGQGYYAQMRRSAGRTDIESGQATTWEVAGPDWSATVIVREPSPGAAMSVSVEMATLNATAIEFLRRVGG